MTHPLEDFSVNIKNFKCFGSAGSGSISFDPISIIIGKNNTGKSTLVNLIELFISEGKSYNPSRHSNKDGAFELLVSKMITRNEIADAIRAVGPQLDEGYLDLQIGVNILLSYNSSWTRKLISSPKIKPDRSNRHIRISKRLGETASWSLKHLTMLKLAAERSVSPEQRDTNLNLLPTGEGVTNIARAFTTLQDLPREEIEIKLLSSLNTIYSGDSHFKKIIPQENKNGLWEIFLVNDNGTYIPLSESGSSLQSVFIILCVLQFIPHLEESFDWKTTVVAFEEPENNLHPSLLRRLLDFLAAQREEKGFSLVVTTHSPICIDWSSNRTDSCILHVKNTDGVTTCSRALEHNSKRLILEDLDVRGSDILQANGIVWVEGPSDRIYLRKWIDLVSNNNLVEGTHYTVMFYGGKILSHFEALPADSETDLVSLLSINRNAALLMDSDRNPMGAAGKKPRIHLNQTKRRIRDEITDIGGFAWITEGREVENYVPDSVWRRMTGEPLSNLNAFTKITDLAAIKALSKQKVSLSHMVTDEITLNDIQEHLDLLPQLEKLCSHINKWNGR